MEQKNRFIITCLITLLIVGTVFASIGRGVYFSAPPRVVLAQPDLSAPGQEAAHADPAQAAAHRVEVTAQTVQGVIASLSRPRSYWQEVSVETFWSDASRLTAAQIWVDSGWTQVRQTLPSGLVWHDIIGEGRIYSWFDGSPRWHSAEADTRAADLAGHLPTYEDVLDVTPESILAAGYVLLEEIPCVYVRISTQVPGYEHCYWVRVDNGLLLRAETWDGGALTYQMRAEGAAVTPCPSEAGLFTLPDGSVLHSV